MAPYYTVRLICIGTVFLIHWITFKTGESIRLKITLHSDFGKCKNKTPQAVVKVGGML